MAKKQPQSKHVQRLDLNAIIYRTFGWMQFSVKYHNAICCSLTLFVLWSHPLGLYGQLFMLHRWQWESGSWLIAVQWRGVIYTYGQLDWLEADLWPRQTFLSLSLSLTRPFVVFFFNPSHDSFSFSVAFSTYGSLISFFKFCHVFYISHSHAASAVVSGRSNMYLFVV